MRHVSDLLRTPAGRGLTLVAGPWDARPVDSVVLVDEMWELECAPTGALAILSRNAARACDVLDTLRIAGRRDLAAVLLPGSAGTTPGVVELARRVGVALLTGGSEQSLSDTVLGLGAALRADPDLLLRRTREAIDRLGAMEGAGEDDVLRAASAAVGVEFGVAEVAEHASNAAVIRVDGRPDGYVRWHGEDPAAAIVAGVVAAMLGRVRVAALVRERAREQALLALLRAGTGDLRAAARRARHAGVPVDGWHVAVFLRDPGDPGVHGDHGTPVRGAEPARPPGDVVLRQVRRAAAGAGVDPYAKPVGTAVGSAVGTTAPLAAPPLTTPWQDGLLVVFTTDEPVDGPPEAGAWPGFALGVGTCQAGPEGLRRTAAQARAAASRAVRGEVVRFDRLGVHAILAELSGSQSALMAARDMLAPLDGLGALSAHAVPTLKAYLDAWGSRTRAAEVLTLHPNAVAHRIRRISEALGADLSDPQTRFALQLACHVVLEARP
ncbi:helix-turn-helix domain-containing protein [Microbispora sp. RL4-1S]|uniref:Helix-turn-helix domain-containing protein n=1 Tax=Microbispora oryzae TaxID=2806554 RepID=A0A941AMR5_9ACTN|nr:helix-turn-helix domain-containing protein [Microbispora oryzae]MBP2707578.1 helix-turn-helix domain-containing protein [Microbispora oryzae]